MNFRWAGVAFAGAIALAAHSAWAQPVSGCPAGQALQSTDASGRNVVCVPIPDVSALQGAINGEAAARAAGDAHLQSAINGEAGVRAAQDGALQQLIENETLAREAADAALRESINESSIVGRYVFTGSQTCLNSSLGFNPDLTPAAPPPAPPFPPPPLPGEPVPPPVQVVSNIVSQTTTTVWGYRTFNADGTGTAEFYSVSINHPSFFYNGFGTGLTSIGPNRGPTGGVGTSHLTGTFSWRVENGKLIVGDEGDSATGTVTNPGPRFGWILKSENVPPMQGILGKDLKTISMIHETPGVEIGVLMNPNNPNEVFRTPRVCLRDRVLRKL